jgi:hypothetical protein
MFGGGASKPPAASQPGNMFGAAGGAAAPSFGFNKPGGNAAKPSVFGGAGGTGGASTAPSFAFNTTCRVVPKHSLRNMANKELKHPHPPPHLP